MKLIGHESSKPFLDVNVATINNHYGETHAGKTTNGEIVLKIWRIDDSDHNKGFTSVDTIPRMGYAIMHGTFPMLIDEVPDLNDPRYRDLVEASKNAVRNETFRSKVEGVVGGSKKSDYRPYPALSAFYLTGNPFPPDDTAFQRRIFPTYYLLADSFRQMGCHRKGS